MSHQVVRVRREKVKPCMTCPICDKLLRHATTIIECLHTFCRKCIHKKLSDEEMECCPVCKIDLGCSPLEKLRADHNLQDVRAKIFPYKRINAKAPEFATPVTLPAKRKERSLSSLVVSAPRVSSQGGMTGRRSKFTARKAASRGPSFTIGRPLKKDKAPMGHPESSGSPDIRNKFSQNSKQNFAAAEPSNHHPGADKKRENGSEGWEGKVDPWKPLNCLVEAANRSKSSKFAGQGSVPASDANEGLNKNRSKEQRQKSKVQEEKKYIDRTPLESERPKKLRKIRQKKAHNYGDPKVPPQVVLDAANAKSDRRNHPIWFSLVSDEQEGDARPLPQIAASYLRIKDGTIPISCIQKYLKMKLNLTSEDEIDINCMGQSLIPTLPLGALVDLWLQTTSNAKVQAKIGSSAKDFVMVLGYTRKAPIS